MPQALALPQYVRDMLAQVSRNPPGTGATTILRGSSLPVRIRPHLQGRPIPARRPYRAPVLRRRLLRRPYPTRPAHAAPSLGTRIEDAVVLQGARAGLTAIPWIGPALAPLAPLVVKPIEAVLGAVVGGVGDLFGAFGPTRVLTVADYVAMGKLTATPGSPVVDVGIRRGRNM